MRGVDYVHLREALADALSDEWARLAAYLARRLAKAADEEPDDDLARAMDAYDWRPLGQALQSQLFVRPLAMGYHFGVGRAEASLGLIWGRTDPAALAYARARAAEMVGMRRTPSGLLVPNPDARWRITDETRGRLRELVTQAMEKPGFSYRDLKERIEEMPGFTSLLGEYRADMIARSELALAANEGTLEHFGGNGIEQVQVLDNPNCPVCGPFAGTTQTMAWARAHAIGHPNCIRAFNAVGRVRVA